MPVPFARSASQTRPTFSRDFAGLKTLDHGVGPAITFTRGSDATYFNAAGVLTTATTNEPRFDHNPSTGASLGLLIEESRTNSIRNSQAGGSTSGVIGSGGVAPTNWAINSPTGIAREIIGTGTLNGFSYIDVKFSGTNTSGSSGSIAVVFEGTTQVVAASGQMWTGSAYVALIAGSFSGSTSGAVQLVERNVSGGFLNVTLASITAATGSLARYSASRTFTEATTERTNVQLAATVANSSTIDLTLRIAAPQLEQGAFPTSYIPTTTAAATRSADSAVVTPISSFYNQSEGTLFAEAIANNIPLSGQFPRPLVVGSATNNNNRIEFYTYLQGAVLGIGSGVVTNVTNEYSVFNAASSVGSIFKASTAVATNDFRTAVNGSLFGSADTSGSLPDPSTMTHLFIGRISTGIAAGTSFYIRKVAYWPKRLSNTLLQQLTT